MTSFLKLLLVSAIRKSARFIRADNHNCMVSLVGIVTGMVTSQSWS